MRGCGTTTCTPGFAKAVGISIACPGAQQRQRTPAHMARVLGHRRRQSIDIRGCWASQARDTTVQDQTPSLLSSFTPQLLHPDTLTLGFGLVRIQTRSRDRFMQVAKVPAVPVQEPLFLKYDLWIYSMPCTGWKRREGPVRWVNE